MSLKNFLTGKVFLKQIVIALLIIVIAVFAILKWLDSTTNHGQEIPVPDLVKMSVEKAGQTLEAASLEFVVLDTVEYRSEYPAYTVVQQDPLPKVTVKENRKVYVKINAGGYNDIIVPDLVQKTYRQAQPTIKAIGLVEGKVTYKPYLAKDVVLEMWQDGKKLKAGDKVQKASKIDLVLGDGKVGYDEEYNDNGGEEVTNE